MFYSNSFHFIWKEREFEEPDMRKSFALAFFSFPSTFQVPNRANRFAICYQSWMFFFIMLSVSSYFISCPFATLLITGGMKQACVPYVSEAEVLSAPPKLVYGKLILR